jgi:hypothetical protein
MAVQIESALYSGRMSKLKLYIWKRKPSLVPNFSTNLTRRLPQRNPDLNRTRASTVIPETSSSKNSAATPSISSIFMIRIGFDFTDCFTAPKIHQNGRTDFKSHRTRIENGAIKSRVSPRRTRQARSLGSVQRPVAYVVTDCCKTCSLVGNRLNRRALSRMIYGRMISSKKDLIIIHVIYA